MSKPTAEIHKKRWFLRLSLLVVAAVGLYLVVTAVQVVSASRQDERGDVDAIVVLGAAQYDGRPSKVLRERLDHALKLYNDGVAPAIMLTGSKRRDDRFTEAYAGFRYLRKQGVPDRDLVIVDDGKTTYESLAAASKVLRKLDLERVVMVSSSYHNRRLERIASELGLTAQVSPIDGAARPSQVVGETMRVAVGEIIGYRRLYNTFT